MARAARRCNLRDAASGSRYRRGPRLIEYQRKCRSKSARDVVDMIERCSCLIKSGGK